MNYLNSNPVGGMYLHSNDLRWMHDAYKNCFKNLTYGLALQDYRLFGAEVVDLGNGFYGVSEGAIALDGEICKVEAHTIPNISGQTPYWEIEERDNPTGVEEFENQVAHSTYKERVGVIRTSATPPMDYTPSDMKTVLELIAENVNNYYNISVTFSVISSAIQQLNTRLGIWQNFSPNLSGTAIATQLQTNFRYRLSLNTTLYLNCHFTFSIGINGLTSFSIDLPASLKSNTVASFMAGFSNTGLMIGTVDNTQGNDDQILINTTGFGVGAYIISFVIALEVKP